MAVEFLSNNIIILKVIWKNAGLKTSMSTTNSKIKVDLAMQIKKMARFLKNGQIGSNTIPVKQILWKYFYKDIKVGGGSLISYKKRNKQWCVSVCKN